MIMANAQQELAEFVISKAFNPVMRAKPGGKSDADRKTLEHVQQATKAEIERYRNYDSAQQVVVNFKRDLRLRRRQEGALSAAAPASADNRGHQR